jgi:hypothetical protein
MSSTAVFQRPVHFTNICQLCILAASWERCTCADIGQGSSSQRTSWPSKTGPDRLYRNVGTELQLYAAQNHRKVQKSFTWRQMPEITPVLICFIQSSLISVMTSIYSTAWLVFIIEMEYKVCISVSHRGNQSRPTIFFALLQITERPGFGLYSHHQAV